MDTDGGARARNRVETRSEGDVRVVVMSGEFDMDNVDELRTALDPAAVGVSRFVLDVTGVTFADSTALNIMLKPVRALPVVLAGTIPARLARLLQVTGADGVFAAAPTVAAAKVVPLPPRGR
ncbi:STAS domain-containing protein [Streptomyces sp. G-G2]|uniref:STAS domain-containing protein n=1 Tax=Streptomyces sp. G-G2 TaxID=3046201 RepID=UPI0024B99EBC|nr:STAS domain-containing protein [Streptomyces sp. G-G2]MDJ0382773.1 STAS domain-containing protein [Streptomyces sp. G-G2]